MNRGKYILGSNLISYESMSHIVYEGDVISIGGILLYNSAKDRFELSKPFVIVGGGL